MSKILEGTAALFLVISGACWRYSYNVIALLLLCLFVVLSFIDILLRIRNYRKSKHKKEKAQTNLQEFTFVDPPGYYTHPKYSYWICPYCLIEKKRISPVSKIDENAWYCNVCDKPLSGTKGEVFTVDN